MGIVQGIDGSMLLNAFRQGREDRSTVQDRALQRMYQQRQMERQDKLDQRETEKWDEEKKLKQAYADIFASPRQEAQPAGDGSTSPVAQPADPLASSIPRPNPEALRRLMALGPEGITAAKAIQSMSADQLKAAQEAAVKAMEIKGRVINSIRALPPEKREAEYQAQKAQLASMNVDVSRLAPHWDEGYADLLIKQSLTGAQALGLEQQAKQFDETVRHNKAGEANAAGNLAVARGRLGVSQGALKVAQDRAAKGGDGGDNGDLSYLMGD